MENSLFKGEMKNFIDEQFSSLTNNISLLETVFHYTSLDSLLKIVENKSLWFTNIGDMNDPEEMEFGQKIIEKIIISKCARGDEVVQCIKDLGKVLFDDFSYTPFYLFSCTQENDSYQQWINYGDSGEGLSIEFNRFEMYNLLSNNQTTIQYCFPVQYYDQTTDNNGNITNYEQTDINKMECFEEIVISCFNFLTENVRVLGAIGAVVNQNDSFSTLHYYDLYILFSSMIKHHFHKEEREWRFLFSSPKESKYIVQNKSLKEIQEINIMDICELLKSVTIGPKNSQNIDYFRKLERMLKRKINGIKILNSKGKLK